MINVFIPHRWNNDDYETITALLDRTKYNVRDYSVPSSSPFDSIDRRYNVDPQIQRQIKYANYGMSMDEIRFAISIGKPVVAVKITESTSSNITNLNIPVIAKRKDSLEDWIRRNVY